MARPAPSDVTTLLRRLREGQEDAPDVAGRLIPSIDDGLRVIANRIMHNERDSHMLQPTVLNASRSTVSGDWSVARRG